MKLTFLEGKAFCSIIQIGCTRTQTPKFKGMLCSQCLTFFHSEFYFLALLQFARFQEDSFKRKLKRHVSWQRLPLMIGEEKRPAFPRSTLNPSWDPWQTNYFLFLTRAWKQKNRTHTTAMKGLVAGCVIQVFGGFTTLSLSICLPPQTSALSPPPLHTPSSRLL